MPALWSYTTSTDSRADDDTLVVCCLSSYRLGIDALIDEVVELCGKAEGQRWHHARAEDYGARLLDALRVSLPTTELIVHLEEAEIPDKIRVVVSSESEPDPARRESELGDRVEAILQQTWLAWREGLEITMESLRRLDDFATRTPRFDSAACPRSPLGEKGLR